MVGVSVGIQVRTMGKASIAIATVMRHSLSNAVYDRVSHGDFTDERTDKDTKGTEERRGLGGFWSYGGRPAGGDDGCWLQAPGQYAGLRSTAVIQEGRRVATQSRRPWWARGGAVGSPAAYRGACRWLQIWPMGNARAAMKLGGLSSAALDARSPRVDGRPAPRRRGAPGQPVPGPRAALSLGPASPGITAMAHGRDRWLEGWGNLSARDDAGNQEVGRLAMWLGGGFEDGVGPQRTATAQ